MEETFEKFLCLLKLATMSKIECYSAPYQNNIGRLSLLIKKCLDEPPPEKADVPSVKKYLFCVPSMTGYICAAIHKLF